MKKHVNIPIFVTHLGCPHACVFCNQKTISGRSAPDFTKVEGEIEAALSSVDTEKQEAQVAFFGGSFTGIDREDMIYLLSVGKKFIDDGRVKSIRLSTRPDYIDDEIIGILLKYGVRAVELGVQSCSEKVLSICERGHGAEVTHIAAKKIVDAGLEFVGQMMIGLPGASAEDELYTAREIVKMGAVGARIYPTVVFRGTKLSEMAASGAYVPLTEEEMIERSETVFEVFCEAGVNVIRIGLQSSEALTGGEEIACGGYYESTGEMVLGRYFEKKLRTLISSADVKDVAVRVNPRRASCAVGYRGANRERLMREFGLSRLKIVGDESIGEFEVRLL